MSVQFGRWSFDGTPALLHFLESVNTVLAPYGPDIGNSYHKDGFNVVYRGFHATKESRRETQPHICQSGSVITWDGRLDNRADFIHQFSRLLSVESTDISIVATVYDRWGTDCFAKLIGDWALSIWNPSERSLILAKDPVGTRHLYFSVEKGQVTWSTILDPLVLFAGRTFALDEEYIAGWFSFFPAANLTPYVGIDSVLPSSFVRFERGQQTVTKYWDFDPGKRIRYRKDAEYEEHFRDVFARAVQRRLRADTPVLAELSGGMDSSSIVCMADTIIARGAAETPRLDTISYYNDSEPNWNERPYFTKVEEKRGRTGCHIDVSSLECFRFGLASDVFEATPSWGNVPTEASRQYETSLNSHGNRVVLSGTGGDEVTGGVPTPTPELEDLLAGLQLLQLAHQLKLWALEKKKPWLYLLIEAVRGFFPSVLVGVPEFRRPAPWLHPDFVRRHRTALNGYEPRLKLFGPRPSFQENVATLNMLRRQLACVALPMDPPRERRYPYLDRTFLEFMYAVPREQLVRPGQRRSLMRRALVGIVPDQLLSRKRKAFVARAPLLAISTCSAILMQMTKHMVSNSLSIVKSERFCEALENIRQEQKVPIIALMRTIGIERWLQGLRRHKLLDGIALDVF